MPLPLLYLSSIVVLLSFLDRSSGRQGHRHFHNNHLYYHHRHLRRHRRQDQNGFPEIKPEWRAPWPNPRQMEDLKNSIILILLDRVSWKFSPVLSQQMEETISQREESKLPEDVRELGSNGFENPGIGMGMPEPSIYEHYDGSAGAPIDEVWEPGPYYPEKGGDDYGLLQPGPPIPVPIIEPVDYRDGKDTGEAEEISSASAHPIVNVLLVPILLPATWFVLAALHEYNQ